MAPLPFFIVVATCKEAGSNYLIISASISASI